MYKRQGAKPAGGRAAAVGMGGEGEEHEFVFDEIDFVGGLDSITGNVTDSSRCAAPIRPGAMLGVRVGTLFDACLALRRQIHLAL